MRAIATALAALILALPLGASAAQTTVRVDDSAGHPVAGAHVTLVLRDGSTRDAGITDARGELTVESDAAASVSAELGASHSPLVALHAGTRTIVVLTALHVIGDVSVKASPQSPSERRYDTNDALAVALGGLAAARNVLPQYRSAAEGGSDSMTLNGAPLTLPPDAQNAFVQLSDPLLGGFSVATADDGSFQTDYHLPSPSALPRTTLRWDAGSASAPASTGWTLAQTGRAHAVGYAVSLGSLYDPGLLSSNDALDSSGARYAHDTNKTATSAALVLNAATRGWDLELDGFASTHRQADISNVMPGSLLVGDGPGNSGHTTFGNEYVRATRTAGRDTLTLLDVRYAGNGGLDASNALFDGVPVPWAYAYTYAGHYTSAQIERKFADSSLAMNLAQGVTRSAGDSLLGSYGSDTSDLAAGTSYTVRHGDQRLTLAVNAHDRISYAKEFTLEERATFQTTVHGATLEIAGYHAPALAMQSAFATYYAPSSAEQSGYTCAPPSATVAEAPDLRGDLPTAWTLRATARAKVHALDLTAGGFATRIDHAIVQADEPLAAPPPFASAYERVFGVLCPGTNPVRFFGERAETIGALTGREWYADAATSFGAITADLSYETYALTPDGSPSMPSTIIPGAQLPGVPLHRTNLLIAYGRRPLRAALDAYYVSSNNAAHLPGHVSVAGGIELALERGTLALSATNAIGPYASILSSARNAVALPMGSGSYPELATASPRAIDLRYTVSVGPH